MLPNKIVLYAAVYGFVTSIGLTAYGDEPAPAGPLPAAQTPAEPVDAEREFSLRVLPILKAKCFACHGDKQDDVGGEFDIRSLEGLLAGGESGDPAIVPGKPEQSTLMEAITWEGLEMPPKENDRLTEKEIEVFRLWIQHGAPWPDAQTQQEYRRQEWSIESNEDGIIVATSGGSSDEWTYRRYPADGLWAFQPLDRDRSASAQTEIEIAAQIDAFVTEKLGAAGFSAAPQADPITLVRRATFDLLGLPPTPEEISDFRQAWNADPENAWSDLVDRLLESPHYGQRTAQHWLDVTRYADTGGMSNDYERSNLWRYRDYVIRAFNSDKPYDQFIVEQLAGDELADASVLKRSEGSQKAVARARLDGDYTPEEAEWIVATGFLRLGPWDNAMVETDEARQIYLDDTVNIVGQTFLSTTLRCCKCHDHKFDPLPTRDYYRVYAAFEATQMAERKVPFLPSENLDGFEAGEEHVRRMLKFAVDEKNKLVDKRETAAREWFAEHELEYVDNDARKSLPDDEKPPRHVGLDHTEQGQLKVREQDEWIWQRRLERYQPMAQSVYNAAGAKLAWNGARKLRIDAKADPNQSQESFILIGGALTARGDAVGPGVLSATGLPVNKNASDPYRIDDDIAGRRLSLARWIADPANPLTTRSIVNRIWQQHFTRGIAANTNNFGTKGAMPTHRELLDFLASELIDGGWKLKRLHRAIMLSNVYRQAASHPQIEALKNEDADNHLLAYFPTRRLTAEEVRDAALRITGELNPKAGGLPAMPEINMEVALQPRMIQFSIAPAYQPSRLPEDRNRRTIYAYRVRGQADPFLELFNQPNPNESCEARDAASVTPQAFTLFNSDLMTDRSIAFALRLQKERDTLSQQIDRAFELSLCRSPRADERKRLLEYVQDMQVYHQQEQPEPVTFPAHITRSLVEEFSGSPFEYQEILPRFEKYVADPKPADVSADTRALADMCLLLLNANEFMYVK